MRIIEVYEELIGGGGEAIVQLQIATVLPTTAVDRHICLSLYLSIPSPASYCSSACVKFVAPSSPLEGH